MNLLEWISKYWLEVAFGQVCGAFSAAYRHLYSKIKKHGAEEAAQKEATLALLDDAMGRIYRQCCEKEYVTREESRRYERMYAAYTGLGGNGAVPNERDHFHELELRER